MEASLLALGRAAARRTLQRVLVKAGEPIRAAAEAAAPVDTGELAGSIATSARSKNTVGNAEYAEVMRSFGTKAEALKAMRNARRAAQGAGLISFAQVFVGPTAAKSKKDAIKRIVQEFGSVSQPPQPYMRPAWDAHKDEALEIIKRELGGEIQKTAARQAARMAKLAAKRG